MQYDPYAPSNPDTDSNPNRTSFIQAQIDDTVDVMRANIDNVSHRGERLDSLQDKTDNLAVSAPGFRRGANRARKTGPWTRTYVAVTNNVARLSIGGYHGIQRLFSGSEHDGTMAIDGEGESGDPSGEYPHGYYKEEDEGVQNKNIVKELLAEWTTLPPQD